MCSSVYFNMSQCSSEYESCNWGGGGGVDWFFSASFSSMF